MYSKSIPSYQINQPTQRSTLFDAVACLNKLLDYGRNNSTDKLTQGEILNICYYGKQSLECSRNLLDLYAPVKVMGMIQGQFHDLIKIFDIFGHPDRVNYLFLGGYVNKGEYSLETICLLLLYKIVKSSSVHLLRGCDESAQITKIYGFYDQCRKKYNLNIWKKICQIFNALPYGALIEGKIFCVHGGLSPDLLSPKDINNLEHETEIPKEGIACDLVWADPQGYTHGYQKNPRGISYVFGRDVVQKFLYVNNLDMMVRSHQIVQEGFQFNFDKKLLTLCSAPNYLGKFENNAGLLVVDDNLHCTVQVYRPKPIKNVSEKQQQV